MGARMFGHLQRLEAPVSIVCTLLSQLMYIQAIVSFSDTK